MRARTNAAARAAAELRAAGERPRKRTGEASRALTAQETRIELVSALRDGGSLDSD